MSPFHRLLTIVALAAGLTCGAALAQSNAPAPKPTSNPQTSSESSTTTQVKDWTAKTWNAAKRKLSQDKAKWNICNQGATDQRLSGRKSWSYLYDCMTKG
jgi:hypothetical protein